jgi:hypothetical protein
LAAVVPALLLLSELFWSCPFCSICAASRRSRTCSPLFTWLCCTRACFVGALRPQVTDAHFYAIEAAAAALAAHVAHARLVRADAKAALAGYTLPAALSDTLAAPERLLAPVFLSATTPGAPAWLAKRSLVTELHDDLGAPIAFPLLQPSACAALVEAAKHFAAFRAGRRDVLLDARRAAVAKWNVPLAHMGCGELEPLLLPRLAGLAK